MNWNLIDKEGTTIGYLIVIGSGVLAVARFFMPTHPLSLPGSYEAVAHLFVGGLAGAWLVSRQRLYLFALLALTAVEVVAFVALKK